jgi:hypothetical protein
MRGDKQISLQHFGEKNLFKDAHLEGEKRDGKTTLI